MSKDMDIVVCGRVGSGKVVVLPGARVGECHSCKSAIWIGPSSEEKIRAGAATECLECAIPKMREAQARGDLEMLPLKDQTAGLMNIITERILRAE